MPKTKRAKINASKLFLVLAVALGLVAVGFGALLSYYGKVVGTASVSQSVQLDGKTCSPTQDNPTAGCEVTHTASGVAGDVIWSDADSNTEGNQPHILKNTATSATAEVTLTSTESTGTVQTIKYYSAGSDNLCGTNDDGELKDEDTQTSGFQLILGAGEEIKLCFKYVFPVNAQAGNYTITTTVTPV